MYHPLFQDGKIIPIGSKYYRPEYARTLELIADGGADAFYQGEVAEALVKVVRDRGGLMTLDDLKRASGLPLPPPSLPSSYPPIQPYQAEPQTTRRPGCSPSAPGTAIILCTPCLRQRQVRSG